MIKRMAKTAFATTFATAFCGAFAAGPMVAFTMETTPLALRIAAVSLFVLMICFIWLVGSAAWRDKI